VAFVYWEGYGGLPVVQMCQVKRDFLTPLDGFG
jgi:hypothetical protein